MRDNEADQIAEGRLSRGIFEDAAGRLEQAFILTLPEPACLASDDPVGSTVTIHIFSLDEAIAGSIREICWQRRACAYAFRRPHRAHHAPIVMDVSEIDEI